MTYQQLQNSLLRLVHWPELSHLPQPLLVDTARICALLAWRATAGALVPRILALPKERVEPVLLRLQQQGCLNVSDVTVAAGHAPAEAAPPPASAAGAQMSLIGKIWQRLAGRPAPRAPERTWN